LIKTRLIWACGVFKWETFALGPKHGEMNDDKSVEWYNFDEGVRN
jgi:hypothetical protein